MYASVKNYDSITISIILSLIGYFFIDAYILINKKSRDSEICEDLYNVVNSICLQLSAHVSMKDSLKYQFENCKNNDLKRALIEFSTCYELSELNINDASKALEEKFDILEINMFCNALSEYNHTGNVIEVLENLSDSLCEKRVAKIKSDTRTKILYITFGVIIALTNIILLIFYPLFISLSTNFNNIFK
jgi:Flp pilus assembly protein TadB